MRVPADDHYDNPFMFILVRNREMSVLEAERPTDLYLSADHAQNSRIISFRVRALAQNSKTC